MKVLSVLVFALFAATSWAGDVDPAFAAFWQKFRSAVERNDAEAVSGMTKLPFLVNGKKLNRAEFAKIQGDLFESVRENLRKVEIVKEKPGYFVFSGEEILIFEKAGKGWVFTEFGVND